MPKQSKVIKNQETVHFSDDERIQLQALLDRALADNRGYAPKQHVLKELIGIWEFNLTTEKERKSLLVNLTAFSEEKHGPFSPDEVPLKKIKGGKR